VPLWCGQDQALLAEDLDIALQTCYQPERDVIDGSTVDEEAVRGQRTWTVQGRRQACRTRGVDPPRSSRALARSLIT
jgi:hypothetical protein